MKQLLITGGRGQVASALAQQARDFEIISLAHEELDITSSPNVDAALKKYQPDFIINTAAYTAVDKAEENKEQAFLVNHVGAQILAKASASFSIPLLHLSTDYIFDGKKNSPYVEDDTPSPVNIYGESKLKAEQAIRESSDKHIILRLSAIFSEFRNNFVKNTLLRAKDHVQLTVVSDQITCPTPAADIADCCLNIIRKLNTEQANNPWGTYHYCSEEPVSWSQFAEAIMDIIKDLEGVKLQSIEPILAKDRNSPASRPMNSVLDCAKIRDTFGIATKPWSLSLEQTIKVLCQ